MNRKADYIFFEPTTRYYLIQSILNKKITNVYRSFKSEKDFNEMQSDLSAKNQSAEGAFCSFHGCYTIEFEGNMSVDISRRGSTVMIKHSNRYGHKWSPQGFMYQAIQWGLKEDIFNSWEMTQVLGQKIVNINFFIATIGKSFRKHLAFELSDQSSLIFGCVNEGIYSSILYVPKNNPFLKNLDKDELSLEIPNLDFEMLEDYWAAPNELVDNEYIELYYDNETPVPFTINTDIYWDKLSKKPVENYEILNSILSNIFQFQMGIMDLRFGLTKEGEIRLVKPIDICVKRVFDNNVYFINSLMDTIYKHVPEKIEKYYLE